MLNKEQTAQFLTHDDLLSLSKKIETAKAVATLGRNNVPVLEIRGKLIPLFFILELIGKL